MSLRRKTLLAIAITFAGLFVLLFVLSRLIILDQFDRLQSEDVHEDVQRILNTLHKEIDTLGVTAKDWSDWDDTYQFVQDNNQTYIDANLRDITFDNLDLNFVIYTNTMGKVVFRKAYDVDQQADVEFPNDLTLQTGALAPLFAIPKDESTTGIVQTSQGLVLVAARSILTSAQTGPVRGVLIMGRYLDQAEVAELGEQTQLNVSLMSVGSPDAPLDFRAAQAALSVPNTYPSSVDYVHLNHTARGYALLRDYTGKPAAVIRVQMPDSIYQTGEKAVLYLLGAMLLGGVIIAVVILWWAEKSVLSRVAFLDQRMIEIGNSDDLSARITMNGKDELARLAATINDSLAKREHSQEQKLQGLNEALTCSNAQLEEKVIALKQNQKYKDRFFAHASHEFRTPLTIMGTRLYLAKKKPELWENHIQVLEETQRRLLKLVDDVFDMTRLHDNSLTLNIQRMDLKTFMPMILEDLSARFQGAKSSLSQNFTDEELPVRLDVIYFGRACEKLVTFILELCGPNIEIAVSLRSQMREDKPFACIEISSSAFHFQDEELTEMFSPFHKVSEGNIHTTGLNLAIAKKIIEVHLATLTAYDDSYKGGVFQILLPILLPIENE